MNHINVIHRKIHCNISIAIVKTNALHWGSSQWFRLSNCASHTYNLAEHRLELDCGLIKICGTVPKWNTSIEIQVILSTHYAPEPPSIVPLDTGMGYIGAIPGIELPCWVQISWSLGGTASAHISQLVTWCFISNLDSNILNSSIKSVAHSALKTHVVCGIRVWCDLV